MIFGRRKNKWNLIDLWRCNSAATHSGLEAAQAACLSSLARGVHKESGPWDPLLQLTVQYIKLHSLSWLRLQRTARSD